MKQGIRFSESCIKDSGRPPESIPVVPAETLLVDLAQVFASHDTRHVLVKDCDGELSGIVSTEDMRDAIRTFEDAGVGAWHHRTVESLLSIRLAQVGREASDHATSIAKNTETESISVHCQNDLVALLTRKDVLLSWNRLEPALERVATDALTRLPNRGHFERRFQEEWHRAARLGLTLGVLIVDVDYFKQINDRFGHLRGDLALAAVAECCQTCLRSYDLVARFAGDEFIAITCGCSADEIDLPIRRLQEAARNCNLRFNNEPAPISLSIGAAVVTGGLNELDPEKLLDAADQCLYLAKRQGRDRAFRTELLPNGSCDEPVRVDASAHESTR